jgi:hypothetical protein
MGPSRSLIARPRARGPLRDGAPSRAWEVSRRRLVFSRARGLGVPLWLVALAPTCLAVLALLAGCGSSANGVASKSASEILAASRAAAVSASSVHLVSSSKVSRAKLAVDARMAEKQGHSKVSLLGIAFEAIRTESTLYLKGNRFFDARLEATLGVTVPSGMWLKGSSTGSLAQIGSFTNPKHELSIILGARGTLTKGPRTTINGQPAIELNETTKLATTTLYVAMTGKPYPIETRKLGRETGKTTFTGWNQPVYVTAPSNAVDISQLEHAKGH